MQFNLSNDYYEDKFFHGGIHTLLAIAVSRRQQFTA